MASRGNRRSQKPPREPPEPSRSKGRRREAYKEERISREEDEEEEEDVVAESSNRRKGRDVSRARDIPGTQQSGSTGRSTGGSAGSGYDALGTGMENLSLDNPTLPPTSYRVKQYGNITSVSTQDPATGLSSIWSIGPEAQKTIRGPYREADDQNKRRGTKPPFEGYEPSRDPVRDYVFGRVIEVLVVPPPPGDSTGTRVQRRRYVVTRESTPDQQGFAALPIMTYNGHGVHGQTKWHHCIIYTQRPKPHANPPDTLPAEEPQRRADGHLEPPMQTHAILVVPRDRTWALDPISRLNLVDVHEFEPHVDHVKLFGRVSRDYRPWLHYQYEAVRANINVRVGNVAEIPLPVDRLQAWYNDLSQRALQLGLTRPRPLTEQEVQYLATSHNARLQFSNRLQENWRDERQQRMKAARRRAERGDSDGGSDEGNTENDDNDND